MALLEELFGGPVYGPGGLVADLALDGDFGDDGDDGLSPASNAFCPTGPGGGVDPSCSSGGGGAVVRTGSPTGDLQANFPTDPRSARRVLYAQPAADEPGRDWRDEPGHPVHDHFHVLAALPQGGHLLLPKDGADEKAGLKALRRKEGSGLYVQRPVGREGYSAEIFQAVEAPETTYHTRDYGVVRAKALNERFSVGATETGYELLPTEKLRRQHERHLRTQARGPAGNAFCPTGPGGGVDPSCSSKSTPPGSRAERLAKRIEREEAVRKKLGEERIRAVKGAIKDLLPHYAYTTVHGIRVKAFDPAVPEDDLVAEIGRRGLPTARGAAHRVLDAMAFAGEIVKVTTGAGDPLSPSKMLHSYRLPRSVAGNVASRPASGMVRVTSGSRVWYELPPAPEGDPAHNAFCATGPGGGVDPSCSPGGGGAGAAGETGSYLDRPIGGRGNSFREFYTRVHRATEERPDAPAFHDPLRRRVDDKLLDLAGPEGGRLFYTHASGAFTVVVSRTHYAIVGSDPNGRNIYLQSSDTAVRGPSPRESHYVPLHEGMSDHELNYRLSRALGVKVRREDRLKYDAADKAARTQGRERLTREKADRVAAREARRAERAGPAANYNPNQPRHPAGTTGGGRFAPASGAGVAFGSEPAVRPQATRLKRAGATKEEAAEIGRLGRERTRLSARIKEGTATTEEVRRRKEVVDEIAARKKAVKDRVAKEAAGSKTTDTAGNVTVKGGTAGPVGPGGFLRNRDFLNSDTVKSHDHALQRGAEALDASARANTPNTHRLAAIAHREAESAHRYAASDIEGDLSNLSGPAEVKGSNREAVRTHEALAAHHKSEAGGHDAKANTRVGQPNTERPATPLTIKEVQDHMASAFGSPSRVKELMETHHGESGLVHEHGMSKPEEMEHLEIEGIKFHYPRTDQGRQAAAGTIAEVVSRAHKIPAPLWQAQTDVVHSSGRNAGDNYWAREYKDPGFRSNATGGDGKTVVYGIEPGLVSRSGIAQPEGPRSIAVSSFAHEAGHNFATKAFGQLNPPASSAYHAAQQKEQPVTEYARNSPVEDFAEAAKMYTTYPESLKRRFPLKYKAFHDLMEQHGGGVAAPRA